MAETLQPNYLKTYMWPTIWYNGFKIQLVQQEVLVYDTTGHQPRIVHSEISHNGKNAWLECKKWVDADSRFCIPSPKFHREYLRWNENPKKWYPPFWENSHQNRQV